MGITFPQPPVRHAIVHPAARAAKPRPLGSAAPVASTATTRSDRRDIGVRAGAAAGILVGGGGALGVIKIVCALGGRAMPLAAVPWIAGSALALAVVGGAIGYVQCRAEEFLVGTVRRHAKRLIDNSDAVFGGFESQVSAPAAK